MSTTSDTSIEQIREVCEFDGKVVKPCFDLQKSTDDIHHKGIVLYSYVNSKTDSLEPVRTIYAARSGNLPKEGNVISFCPFCGTKIYAELQALKGDN